MSDKISAEDLEELKQKLSSKWRRLTSGKFYKIKDKEGNIIPFVPNVFQLYYFKNKHNRNIILKARQMWFSTAIQIDYLDDALFNRNFSVGIIAQDKDTAALIRKDKIEVALEHLPELVKDYWKYDKSNSKEITFSNGSSIYVSNSFRWGTLQRLHISEYGKICAKRPQKAREIKTGAIEAVAMWMEVTIESTAEWNEGDFFEKCQKYQLLMNKPLTPLDYKFLFFPRWVEPKYSYEWVVVAIPQEMEDYFTKLYKEFWIELTQGQKNWYYLKRQNMQSDMKREYPSTSKEAFEIAIEWSYFESQINMVYQQNRLTRVNYDSNLPVYTSWDLWGAGWWDSMTIWFFQIFSNQIRYIDYREWSWYSMTYAYEHIIKTKPYKYHKHIGPHDLRVHDQVTGVSRVQAMAELWLEFVIVESPVWAIKNRIQMARDLFPMMYFDEVKCLAWINRLKNYKQKRNDSTWQWMDEVAKNWAQHAADWFCYWVQYIRAELMPNISLEEEKKYRESKMYNNMQQNISR